MNLSRLIAGVIMILTGFGLILIPLCVSLNVSFISLIYGIPILIIGIFILLNKREDKIEQIKQTGGKNGRK
ncbi:unnamed protein product [marine sediment metagenome]|uniref:Uncharacterized protein n=1 Tax=marine sediment metagenome TaxID=412755 RepID=X1UPF0_9ZZZZ